MTDTLENIVAEITIDAPMAAVWKAMIDPAVVTQWLGCLQFKAVVGHVFYMQPDPGKREAGDIEGATHCEILDIDADGKFMFSWYLPGTPKTTVTLTVTAADADSSLVRLVHDGWDQFPREAVEQIWQALDSGWRSAVLPQLRSVVESS